MRKAFAFACCLALFAAAAPSTTCDEGDYRWFMTENCCPGPDGGMEMYLEQCVNGQWEDGGFTTCAPHTLCPPWA
jgi:hypothetical protein